MRMCAVLLQEQFLGNAQHGQLQLQVVALKHPGEVKAEPQIHFRAGAAEVFSLKRSLYRIPVGAVVQLAGILIPVALQRKGHSISVQRAGILAGIVLRQEQAGQQDQKKEGKPLGW